MKYNVGVWSFFIGLILATILAIFTASDPPVVAVFIIAVFGAVVGLLNITDKEIKMFLIASISFLLSFQALSTVFSVLAFGWQAVATFFNLLSIFIAPATAIVAIKALYNIVKD